MRNTCMRWTCCPDPLFASSTAALQDEQASAQRSHEKAAVTFLGQQGGNDLPDWKMRRMQIFDDKNPTRTQPPNCEHRGGEIRVRRMQTVVHDEVELGGKLAE